MSSNGNGYESLSRDDYAGLLIDRLASAIVDDSLALKDVERELRGSVADVAVHRRGLGKRETASRCGVTEKTIENYLKEVRKNPKSPEREIARVLQDEMLTLEEVYEVARPLIAGTRSFTLDDVKRALEKLIRTGEVQEYPGHKYRTVDRPSIRYPATVEAHRELVDQKARDLDYIVIRQKDIQDEDLGRGNSRYSRVVGDTNLVRIDFTVAVEAEKIGEFYEKLSQQIAKLTMKYEKKNGPSRVRLLLGMRSVVAILALSLCFFVLMAWKQPSNCLGSWELDRLVQRSGGSEEGGSAPPASETGAQGSSAPLAGDDLLGAAPDESPTDDGTPGAPPLLLRGDVNLNESIEITDAIRLTAHLFDGEELSCLATADVDASGDVTVYDAYLLFRYLYTDSPDLSLFRPEPIHPEDLPGGDSGDGGGGLGCDALAGYGGI